jgi:hypothetical protein
VLDVLRNSQQAADRGGRQYGRSRVSGEAEALRDELDPLALGWLALARRGYRRLTR